MSVRVLYFAQLRETLGLGQEDIDLPEAVTTVGGLRDWLAAEGRGPLATTPNLRFAVNQEMARASDPVLDRDEVAFFPPVTGG